MLCTCRAPYHIQTPRSWTPCWLISASQCLVARREKREEKEKREEGREKKERKKKERESKKEKEEN